MDMNSLSQKVKYRDDVRVRRGGRNTFGRLSVGLGVLDKSYKLLMWLKTYYLVWLVTLNWNKAEHLATKDILLLGNILLEFVVGCEILIKAT